MGTAAASMRKTEEMPGSAQPQISVNGGKHHHAWKKLGRLVENLGNLSAKYSINKIACVLLSTTPRYTYLSVKKGIFIDDSRHNCTACLALST